MILLMKGAHMYTALVLLIIAGLYCLVMIAHTYDKLHTLERLPSRMRLRKFITIQRTERQLWQVMMALGAIAGMITTLILLIGVTP